MGVGAGVVEGVGCRGAGVWAAVIVSVMLVVVVALHAHKCFQHAGPSLTMVIDLGRQIVHSMIKIQNFSDSLLQSIVKTLVLKMCTCNPIDFLRSADLDSVLFHRRGLF